MAFFPKAWENMAGKFDAQKASDPRQSIPVVQLQSTNMKFAACLALFPCSAVVLEI